MGKEQEFISENQSQFLFAPFRIAFITENLLLGIFPIVHSSEILSWDFFCVLCTQNNNKKNIISEAQTQDKFKKNKITFRNDNTRSDFKATLVTNEIGILQSQR